MSKITLCHAVELLHKDGDPIDVAVTRIRAAAAAGKIRSWGLLIGQQQFGGDLIEHFETKQVHEAQYYHAWNYGKIDWEHSAIEIPAPYGYDEKDWCYYSYFSRIELSRDAFDRVFFPDKVKPAEVNEPEYPQHVSVSYAVSWLDQTYDGKPRPSVRELWAAAKAHNPPIPRALLELAEARKWPEPRPKGRRRKCAG
jgi:hypothetical protein